MFTFTDLQCTFILAWQWFIVAEMHVWLVCESVRERQAEREMQREHTEAPLPCSGLVADKWKLSLVVSQVSNRARNFILQATDLMIQRVINGLIILMLNMASSN